MKASEKPDHQRDVGFLHKSFTSQWLTKEEEGDVQQSMSNMSVGVCLFLPVRTAEGWGCILWEGGGGGSDGWGHFDDPKRLDPSKG